MRYPLMVDGEQTAVLLTMYSSSASPRVFVSAFSLTSQFRFGLCYLAQEFIFIPAGKTLVFLLAVRVLSQIDLNRVPLITLDPPVDLFGAGFFFEIVFCHELSFPEEIFREFYMEIFKCI